jgi:ATP-dependent DNA helicase RecQ
LIRCAEEGHELDWSRIIPAGYEQQIVEVIQHLGSDKLRPIKDALPEEITYFAIHGVICKYGLKG